MKRGRSFARPEAPRWKISCEVERTSEGAASGGGVRWVRGCWAGRPRVTKVGIPVLESVWDVADVAEGESAGCVSVSRVGRIVGGGEGGTIMSNEGMNADGLEKLKWEKVHCGAFSSRADHSGTCEATGTVVVDVVRSGMSPDKGGGERVDSGRFPLAEDGDRDVGVGDGLRRAGLNGRTISRSASLVPAHRSRPAEEGSPSVANSRRDPAYTGVVDIAWLEFANELVPYPLVDGGWCTTLAKLRTTTLPNPGLGLDMAAAREAMRSYCIGWVGVGGRRRRRSSTRFMIANTLEGVLGDSVTHSADVK